MNSPILTIPLVYLKNMDTGETVNIPVKTKTPLKFINASKCKKFALEFSKANRSHKFTRVSEDFLISCDAAVRNHIQSRIKGHPSVGKTLQ
jgi:hypothetical protein